MSLTWTFRSAIPSVEWPAVPGPGAAIALALQYQLEQTQWWPVAELQRHQFRQLQVMLNYAYDTLHFWRGRLKAAGYKPQQDITPEWFRSLPLLTRAEVQLSDSRNFAKWQDTSVDGRNGSELVRRILKIQNLLKAMGEGAPWAKSAKTGMASA